MSGAVQTTHGVNEVNTVITTKAGWKTTEFWGKVVVQVIGLLVVLGVIHPVDTTDPTFQLAVQYAGGILALVVPEIAYAISRGLAKLPIKLPG